MSHLTTDTRLRRQRLAAATILAASAVVGGTAYAGAQAAPSAPAAAGASAAVERVNLQLKPSSPELKHCFPYARANVTVALTTEALGKDTFTIRASGLKPRTPFTVFLLEKSGAPFGAAEYIGDFDTDRYGRATNRYDLIVEEAFAFNNETQDRTDLNKVGIWFADPADDDSCLGWDSPVTGFDGDGEAGVQMLNSGRQALP